MILEPKRYRLTSGSKASVDIHPSRVIRFVGAELPDRNLMIDGWGDSVLQAVDDAVKHAGSAAAAIAALIQEAKVDVIKMPRLMEMVATEEYRAKVIERFTLANTAKSMVNAILLDAEEEWSQKQVSFTNLPEVLNTYLQIASGAADIPATRLLGQTPGGLQSTGESDLRNYYDRISAGQNLNLRPALNRLDEVLLRSALGERPPEVHYNWAPLWQISEKERADIAESKAKTTKIYADTGLLPDPALGKALQNQLVEDGTYPGLDEAMDEFGEMPDDGVDDDGAGGTQNRVRPFADAFDPNQPRDPAGTATGGQWTGGSFTEGADLTAEQQDAVRAYMSLGYKDMNGLLRNGTFESWWFKTKKAVQDAIKRLDEALQGNKLTSDAHLFRAIDAEFIENVFGEAGPQVGDALKDAGFVSTNKDLNDTLREWSGVDNTWVFKIDARKGQKALDVEKFKGDVQLRAEREVIFPRGTVLEIIAVDILKKTANVTIRDRSQAEDAFVTDDARATPRPASSDPKPMERFVWTGSDVAGITLTRRK